jgi:hypothetical protein
MQDRCTMVDEMVFYKNGISYMKRGTEGCSKGILFIRRQILVFIFTGRWSGHGAIPGRFRTNPRSK